MGAEFDKNDHDSIPAATIGRKLKPLDIRNDPKPNNTDSNNKNIYILKAKVILYMIIVSTLMRLFKNKFQIFQKQLYKYFMITFVW